MSVTRKKTELYLIGQESKDIVGNKLPSNRQVLSFLLYNTRSLKKTLRESTRATISKTEEFWLRARIPVRDSRNSIPQLEKLYENWRAIQRNASRRSQSQISAEESFVKNLDSLFDIAAADALKNIRIAEDKEFLLAQRENGRRGFMSGVDKILEKKESRRTDRKQKEMERKRKFEESILESTATSTICKNLDDDSDAEGIVESSDDVDFTPKTHVPSQTMMKNSSDEKKKNLITPELVAVLDRAKVSNRDATRIVNAAAKSMNIDINSLTSSRTSIQRTRQKVREQTATRLKDQFVGTGAYVVHWDGKILPNITNKESVDRLPIIVSGLCKEKLLGVPKLASGTGIQQATAVHNMLEEWGLASTIQAMCFDTTSSNTGSANGTCVILEGLLHRDLLYLPCRHHIYEIILRAVFESYFGATSAPNVLIFDRFKKAWLKINTSEFSTIEQDREMLTALENDSEEVQSFCLTQLQQTHSREDYRELLELVVIFLAGCPQRGIHFRAPGPVHHARWMAKAIYCLKIFLFKEQFLLTAHELKGINGMCLFITRLYVKAWFVAPLSLAAPYNDLNFIKSLYSYENEAVALTARNKLASHLWYLGEEQAALAFFDPAIPLEKKKQMVQSLKTQEGKAELCKRFQVPPRLLHELAKKDMADFITVNSARFFARFGISTEFLDADPCTWDSREDYEYGRKVVTSLRVVNDTAERGVALMEQFSSHLTKNEEQFQYVLQVVEDYRQRFPSVSKSTLAQSY
jgi:hypothetical protein